MAVKYRTRLTDYLAREDGKRTNFPSSFLLNLMKIGKNLYMVYAICALIISVFTVLFLLFKPKIREEYCVRITDNAVFKDYAQSMLKAFPTPKQGGAKLYENNFVSAIKSSLRTIKRRKNKPYFKDISNYEPHIKSFIKTKYDELYELPVIEGIPRIVKIAEFCLKTGGYSFDGDRVATALNLQNDIKTLCFDEILALKKAFEYVLLKKLAFLNGDLKTLCKMKRIADKNRKYLSNLKDKKTYQTLKNSKLFLSFCADDAKFDSEVCIEARDRFLKNAENMLGTIFVSQSRIENADFSGFYSPLQIFGKYETFVCATEVEKYGFLKLVEKLSDKENIDEFLFSIRVDNYMKTANSGHIRVVRSNLFNRHISVIYGKKDVSMLALAFSSPAMMTLIFGGGKQQKSQNTITQNFEFENTFEKISKFQNVNLGISTRDGKLKINPNLPLCVVSADVCFEYRGTKNRLTVLRGEEKALYLGGTRLTGTSAIKLGDKPIDITVVLPKNK